MSVETRILHVSFTMGSRHFDLSESMGTSITMLQKHYAHVIMEMRGKELVKDVDLKETGGLVFD